MKITSCPLFLFIPLFQHRLRPHFVLSSPLPIMPLQTVSTKPGPKRTTKRLRSACDACHQAKTKCSGTNPCLSCQISATLCTYSPCNQPGRPKGSKNKPNLIHVKEQKGEHLESSRLHTHSSPGLRQPQTFWSEPIDFDLTPSVLDSDTFVEQLCNASAPSEGMENHLFEQVRLILYSAGVTPP